MLYMWRRGLFEVQYAGMSVPVRAAAMAARRDGYEGGMPEGTQISNDEAFERWLAGERSYAPELKTEPLFVRLDAAGRFTTVELQTDEVGGVFSELGEEMGLEPLASGLNSGRRNGVVGTSKALDERAWTRDTNTRTARTCAYACLCMVCMLMLSHRRDRVCVHATQPRVGAHTHGGMVLDGDKESAHSQRGVHGRGRDAATHTQGQLTGKAGSAAARCASGSASQALYSTRVVNGDWMNDMTPAVAPAPSLRTSSPARCSASYTSPLLHVYLPRPSLRPLTKLPSYTSPVSRVVKVPTPSILSATHWPEYESESFEVYEPVPWYLPADHCPS